MRVFAVAVVLSVLLTGVPLSAQAPAAAPAQPQGQQQKPTPPAAPTPQSKPAVPAVTQPAATLPTFQEGMKYAYIQVQVIASESAEGRAATTRIKSIQDQKQKELQTRQTALQTAQEKLEKSGSVLSDQARAQQQAEVERMQRDLQRFTEDAQQEIQGLTQQLQAEFERKLLPVVDKVAREKQLHFVFSSTDSGLVWADPSMNLTADVIRALDGAAKPAPATPR